MFGRPELHYFEHDWPAAATKTTTIAFLRKTYEVGQEQCIQKLSQVSTRHLEGRAETTAVWL